MQPQDGYDGVVNLHPTLGTLTATLAAPQDLDIDHHLSSDRVPPHALHLLPYQGPVQEHAHHQRPYFVRDQKILIPIAGKKEEEHH